MTMLDTIDNLTLRLWVALQTAELNSEEGAEGPEYLALAGAIILLLVAVGAAFKSGGGEQVGNPFLGFLGQIISLARAAIKF
jgi:hypothetical protein